MRGHHEPTQAQAQDDRRHVDAQHGKDDKTGKKPEPETAEPDVEMDTNEEGGPKIEEMDVD